MIKRGPSEESPFHVPLLLHLLGGLVHRYPRLWLGLGRLETDLLVEQLRSLVVDRPIYVCGLARSGSTLLHEVIASHPTVATHRIKDYPMVFTPYWWRRATANLRPGPPCERLHQDRVMVTSDSPDALEEMIWMAFFPRCHDPAVCNLLGARDCHPAFESFYDAHLRKLLLAEGKSRYAAKANYHISRLTYLVRLYADARFIIPLRGPTGHIASLRRQQRWFAQGQRQHPRALAYMRWSGHFEFGLDRRPLNLGDPAKVRQIMAAWAAGEEVRGLALYWAMVHEYLAQLLASEERVRQAALVVRFETLCAEPAATLRTVLHHCGLSDAESIVERYAAGIRLPDYYDRGFSPEELTIIRRETDSVASMWGY